MSIKKVLILLFACVILMTMVGCSSKPAAPEEAASEAPVEEVKEKITIKYTHNYPSTFSHFKAAEKFKELVESKSDGMMEIQLYPNAQLGSNREQVEGIQQGSIEMGVQPTAFLTVFAPEMEVLDLPYLFPSIDGAWNILDSEVGANLLKSLDKAGIKGIAFTGMGFKQITTGKNEIKSPQDLKGLKMRIMQSPIIQAQYEAWGSNPIPLSFQELYNGLQQGVVDGQENDIRSIHTQKFYEVQKNMTISDHAFLPSVVMANKKWFDGLTTEQQDIIVQSMIEAVDYDRSLLVEDEGKALEIIKGAGVKVYELSAEEKEPFRNAVQHIYDDLAKKVGQELVDSFVNAAQK